ncbi:MAG: DUF3500 domain-containing protein [Planctomycetes bacterium]|nr:DUF3500 domain-containing protein [Planctomycetota bacterium]
MTSQQSIPRRNFIAAASAVGATGLLQSPGIFGAPSRSSRAESVIGELYESLSDSQKSVVCKGFGDTLRQKVNANWHVVKPLIGSDFFTKSQQSMVHEIVKQLTSPSGYETIKKQTEDDDGGIEAYSMAWFGKPGDSEFEWMLTGRHLTLRADGNTQKKVVFGGPVVYGHGEESAPEDNIFYFQTQKVNKVFQALSTEQRNQALIQATIPGEGSVRVEKKDAYPGISVSALSSDQVQLVNEALTSILGVYREEDSKEARELLEEVGGLKSLSLQFFAKDDLKADGIWDMWRIVGKNTCIHFRGAPHVHAYIHIQNA